MATKAHPWFQHGDQIVTAYGERCAGPGWSNTPIFVIVRSIDGILRQECIQPDERSAEMHAHFPYSALAHAEMTAAVQAAMPKRKARRT